MSYWIETTYMMVVLIIAVLVHEFGHFIGYYIISRKYPPISFKWGIILMGNDESIKQFTITDMMYISLLGILSGLIIISYFEAWYVGMIYAFGSALDLTWIVQYFGMKEFNKIKIGNLETKIVDGEY